MEIFKRINWKFIALKTLKDPMKIGPVARINGKGVMRITTGSYFFSTHYLEDVSKFMILKSSTIIAMGAFTETTFAYYRKW